MGKYIIEVIDMQTVKVKQRHNCRFYLYKRRETGKVKEKFDTS